MGNKAGATSPASERGRRPSGEAGDGRGDRGRWSSRRKLEVVLRLLRGESVDALSRELGVTAARLAQWREAVLASAQAALKSRPMDVRDEEIRRLRSKVGELTMDKELLEARLEMLGAPAGPRSRRSRR